jgi:outer membrane protein
VPKQRRALICALVVLVFCGTSVTAEQGDTEVGFRLMWVTGSATAAGTIADTGSSPTLSSGPGIEFDWVLWPLDELTVEMSIGASPHPVGTSGGSLGGIDGGTVWRLPLSAVAQYRPDLDGKFDPYVGLGFVYNVMVFDESSAYKELLSETKFSNEIDLVAQVGVNYSLDYRWSANLDIRYMGLRTTGTFVSIDGTRDDLSFSMNPWVVGLGFRYRY